MRIESSEFGQGGRIPERFTCDGENVNPPMTISGIPQETESLVLIVDDPDAPSGTFTHWIMFNMDPVGEVNEDGVRGMEGLNSLGKTGYLGPCPPSGVHRYFFRLFALDGKLGLGEGSSRKEIEDAMKGKVIGKAELMGRYGR